MFSQGQLVFAGLFVIAFVIAAIYSSIERFKIHKTFYKGNYKILIGFGVLLNFIFDKSVFLNGNFLFHYPRCPLISGLFLLQLINYKIGI
jgi:hypothetical protein